MWPRVAIPYSMSESVNNCAIELDGSKGPRVNL